MENNQTDFMKNRPVAASANQIKDVYGSQKKSTFTVVSGVLSIVMLVLTVIAWVTDSLYFKVMFTPVLIALIISFFVARHSDKQNAPIEPHDNPDAIFKEHDI